MQDRRTGTRGEQAALAARLRSEGKSWGEIASVLRGRYGVNGRVALRLAHKLSQKDVADEWNARWPDEPKTLKNISYWEQWPSTTGHQPSLVVLSRLAEIYQCSTSDLISDYGDFRHLDDVNRHRHITQTFNSHARPSSPGRVLQGEPIVSDMWRATESHAAGSAHPVDAEQPDIAKEAVGLLAIERLQGVFSAHVAADAMIGSRFLIDAVCSQARTIENICRAVRGIDRIRALRFAIEFLEFCGWLHQDSGDFVCGEMWTNKAFDYAMEIGDQRSISYILMRKSNIATDAGDPDTALGLSNVALANGKLLTPRLRSVVLRQRANAYAALIGVCGETEGTRNSEETLKARWLRH